MEESECTQSVQCFREGIKFLLRDIQDIITKLTRFFCHVRRLGAPLRRSPGLQPSGVVLDIRWLANYILIPRSKDRMGNCRQTEAKSSYPKGTVVTLIARRSDDPL